MVRQCNSSLIVRKCVLLMTVVVIHGTGGEICDKRKCRGPLRVYESLGCTPVYAKPNDCCAESYDCSHLDNLPQDKCYANGHEYSIGEMLRSEDSNPCDIGCVCDMTLDGLAAFVCKPVYCEHLPAEGNYYFRYTHDSCCRNATQICLKDGEERPTCEVDDNTYYDGDLFETKCNRDLRCICMPGYIGENVEPFCRKRNRRGCSILFGSPFLVRRKCAPMFVDGQNPHRDCSNFFRCPSRKDVVIRNYSNIEFAKVAKEEGKVCRFGNMTMRINDELSRRPIHARDCMQCVCEVPPFLTCQRLRDEERCQIQYQDVVISADLSCQNTMESVGAIYTRTNFVTLKYVTDSWGSPTNGFRLVITAVKDPKHTCKDFRCTQNEFCIETDLLCDGVNHCGDGSDEAISTLCANTEASTILGMQTIWFVVALVFLILIVAGLVTTAVLCFCSQRAATPRHPHNAHNAQTHPPVSFPLQQMYGSNGASAGLPVGMTTLKSTTGTLGALGTYGSALGSGVTGATTLPRPGNWLRPAGLRHGHSAARVRLYCQAK